jgi:ferredoxin-NADP reductase
VLKLLDSILDRLTMYRLVLYYLIGLLAAAVVLSALGVLHYSPFAIIFSSVYLVVACWIGNLVFAHVFEASPSVESTHITALILALIITPITAAPGVIFLTAAAGLATASKYLLAIYKKHIFNPAAVAVAITAVAAGQTASWWVGSAALLPFVLVGGILVVRKIRRSQMVIAFLSTAVVATLVLSLINGGLTVNLKQLILNSALFFLAFVMLTEPATSPPTTKKQVWYGVLAGLLFPPEVHLASIYSTPELVLLVGNVFAYAVSPRFKLMPKLAKMDHLAPNIYNFSFKSDRPINFKPGQYMEWTLPHKGADARGNRRYFTLASSPTEATLSLGVKFYDRGSSFKQAMLKLTPQTRVAAGQLSGDFVMPDNPSQKLAFIAGGIGITPFRSMVKYLLDTNQKRNIVLLYSAVDAGEMVYRNVFDEAVQRLGSKVVYWLTGERGFLNAAVIKTEVPDYRERTFYISGTHQMVSAIQAALHELGVSPLHVKTDFFPGYA